MRKTWCVLMLACLGVATVNAAEPVAFPGAEGYAAAATGGRGKEIVHVTTLANSGPGSFRDAVSKPGRTVVFDVGGYIKAESQLHIESDITILGQTAPGDGVGVLGTSVSLSESHNVIVRFMRFRQGLAEKQDKKSAINMNKAHDIMLDHLSIQWGRWDTIDMTECENMTVQNCIIGPGVAPQRFGCLCESDYVTFSHNLWISNQSRNPKSKGKIQYVNNVVYNWGVTGYVGGHSGADHFADLIGNYFIKGPSSNNSFVGQFAATDHLFVSGNVVDLDCDGKANGRAVTNEDFGGKEPPTLVKETAIDKKTNVTVDTAEQALEKVMSSAGASIHRDAVDQKLIADLKTFGKGGSTIKDPEEMGGAATLKSAAAEKDTDHDGIPDAWETAHGLNPADPADASQIRPDGYTNLENYANSLILFQN